MISIRFVAIFYTLMGGFGWALAVYWGGFDPWRWGEQGMLGALWKDALLGAGVGVGTVLLSHLLERWAEWARRLSEAFQDLLGQLSSPQILAIAVFSSIGEELLFRGFLQQGIATHLVEGAWSAPVALIGSSLIFGLLHVGPDWRTFWPWTVMAVVMGLCFGWMYQFTGNLMAPILAHFTINFLNLMSITSGDDEDTGDGQGDSPEE